MITDGLLMFGTLVLLSVGLLVLERTTAPTFFKYVPGMVLMYLVCAFLNTIGLWGQADETRATTAAVKNVLLPAMILLFLLGCDLRKIIRLGPKLLLTYFVAALSLALGIVVVYAAFRGALHPESWKVFAALLASWTGGSANMVAVQDVLQAPENIFGYGLITDTIVYSVWLMVMFSSVAVSPRFNRWTRASDVKLDDDAVAAISEEERPITLISLALTTLGAIAVSILAIQVGGLLPEVGDVINGTAWTILIVSLAGLALAHTPLGRTAGANETGTLMLFLVIGQIASGSDFSAFTQAPLYLLAGFLVLAFHALFLVVYAKLTRTELFSLAVASTANIGGIASAPVVAAAYDKKLVPVGVLYALIGSFLGTFVGLAAGQLMSAL